jgi:hypothetical protein
MGRVGYVNITIGPVTLDHADYDAEHDVLYLHVGEPQPGEGEETPEGHVIVPGLLIRWRELGVAQTMPWSRRVVWWSSEWLRSAQEP